MFLQDNSFLNLYIIIYIWKEHGAGLARMLHLDTESQNHVIAQLYKKIVRFNDFNGGDYFKTLDHLHILLCLAQLP